ncbi:glycosyltransferase [Clostridium sp.]|uniref:glycosyltransferase family 4 protein n=1 Tax=Clostridium sp. TaxID=1506 RepID=UPI002FCA2B8A
MKVLLCARGDYLKNTAGDTTILLKMYDYLKVLGVEVDIACSDEDYDYASYDIIHLFDIKSIFDTYKHFKAAYNLKCKIVISPLYFDMSNFYNHIKDMDRLKLWNSCKIYREEMLSKSKLIICSSHYEKKALSKDFNFRGKCKVIHNGIDLEYEDIPLYNFKERYNLNNYVLSVGRICNSKNQLLLSKVCKELELTLVLIGPITEKKYLRKCLEYDNVKYLGFMDDYNVYNAYKFARVYAIPSFVEVTTLSSLEAAASGCNIVVTEEGASKEYFKDMGIYCNPYDELCVKEAIMKGYEKRKDNNLKDYIAANFTWKKAIEDIYNSYLELMK